MGTFNANLSDLQPSQLYICSAKLAAVERSIDRQRACSIDPLPVKRLRSKIVLTDGHTRAFAAFQRGRECVPAYWEKDQLNWEAYEVCVEWCLEEGIRSVADLRSRVVTAKQYEELWYKRCRAMHERLARNAMNGELGNGVAYR